MLHQVSDQLEMKCHRETIEYYQLVEHPLQIIENAVERTDTVQKLKERADKIWGSIIESIPREQPYYGFCHGDVHSGNLYFWNRQPQIFDFDCMGFGYRAYELAVYLWDETSVNDNFIESEQWNNYLKGYQEVRKLSQQEIQLIPAFAALRQLWFIGVIVDATRINNSWDGLNQYFFEQQWNRFNF